MDKDTTDYPENEGRQAYLNALNAFENSGYYHDDLRGEGKSLLKAHLRTFRGKREEVHEMYESLFSTQQRRK